MFRYALLFVWIGVISVLSSSQASSDETSRLIKPLIDFFFPGVSPGTFETIHFLIRKAAHLTEYAILGFLGFRAFVSTEWLRRSSYRFVLAIALVAVVASLDELNQSFEPSRSGAFDDVLLDVCGGIFMVLTIMLIKRSRSSLMRSP